MIVICPYCVGAAELVDDTEIYRTGHGRKLWLCRPCCAWVGCHARSRHFAPIGRLANAELREQKSLAHSAFAPLWRGAMLSRGWSKTKARTLSYRWLADQMGMDARHCSIGDMNVQQCREVIAICSAVRERSDVGRKRAA